MHKIVYKDAVILGVLKVFIFSNYSTQGTSNDGLEKAVHSYARLGRKRRQARQRREE